ncbi:MCE family protein [Pseudonocardia sp. CA-107938]|uniref:MCE family protein n=1 Tax=Pseudonocardia sp. CA-107938 TaxID=3240021 RepID=UPI003D8A8712
MTRGLVIRLAAFLVVTVLASALVVNTLTQPLPGPTVEYSARFTDVQGLVQGSDVRIAGVRVGQVRAVRLVDGIAEVDLEVGADQRLPADAGALVRYADLLGARYVALTRGGGSPQQLLPGAVIPVGRTLPAVDLTALLAGFRPLFDAVSPKQVNQLAGTLVAVFQGEGGRISELLGQLVSVTSTLTGSDEVVGRVLDNLDALVSDLLDRRVQFTDLVSALRTLVAVAVDERDQIGEVLDSASRLADTLAGVARDTERDAARDVRSLHALAAQIDDNSAAILRSVEGFTTATGALGRAAGYGSWVNLYLCNLEVAVGPVQTTIPPNVHSEVCR